MGSVRALLVRGNGKLGESIFHFDLPAVNTCPGRTQLCESLCYATKGRFTLETAVPRDSRWNLRQTRRADFVQRLIDEIRKRGVLIVRIHVSGDFYSARYAEGWLSVMRACPGVQFFFYTRSWRVSAISPVIELMACESNCRVWYSIDEETGLPELVPQGVRLAFMQTSEHVAQEADLVFRLRRLRRQPRVGLPMVCPDETPEGRAEAINCGSCGHCWR